ncbi:VG15 protein [Kitasatospora sp. NPDC003701]
MARRSDRARQLVQDHRVAQARVGARAAALVLRSWHRLVRPAAPATSAGPWLTEALDVVRDHRGESERLGAAFLRYHRALETGFTLPPLEPSRNRTVSLRELRQDYAAAAGEPDRRDLDDNLLVPVDQDFEWPDLDDESMDTAARTSLWVTGPVHAEQRLVRAEEDRTRGRLDEGAFLSELGGLMRDAGTTAAGAADREVLRGGRALTARSGRADRRVIGWARVTDTAPCAWCAMLASRGAVYKTRDSAGLAGGPPVSLDDLTKYHDMCHCQLTPIYSRDSWLPDGSDAWRDLWKEATDGLSGPEATRAFNRAVAARRRNVRRRALPTARRS